MEWFIIVSAARGVYAGNNQFHRDAVLPTEPTKCRYPAWPHGRAFLMMQDIKDSGGPDDLAGVAVDKVRGKGFLLWEDLIRNKIVSPLVAPC